MFGGISRLLIFSSTPAAEKLLHQSRRNPPTRSGVGRRLPQTVDSGLHQQARKMLTHEVLTIIEQ